MKQCEFCRSQVQKPCATEAGTVGCRRLQARRDADRIERDVNLEFMRDPDKWPLWPILPLKRRSNIAGIPPETGFMAGGWPGIVYRGNLHEVKTGMNLNDHFSRSEFLSLEAVVAAGWRVD